nr:D-alanyl-D-alanine carboxypeptidase [Streptomyces cupreus]
MARTGVDTATRVLSASDLAEARRSPEKPEATEKPEASNPAPGSGNDRLRAAVAAWVATGDKKQQEPAEGAEAADTAEERAEEPAGATETAEAEDSRAADASADAANSQSADAGGDAEDSQAAGERDEVGDSQSGEAGSDARDSQAAEASGDAEDSQAAGERDEVGDSQSGEAEDSQSADASGEAEAGTDAEAEGEQTAAPDADSGPDADADATELEPEGAADSTPEADAKPEADERPKAEAATEDDAPDSEPDASANTTSAADAQEDAPTASATDTEDDAPDSGPNASANTKPATDTENDAPGSGPNASANTKPATDTEPADDAKPQTADAKAAPAPTDAKGTAHDAPAKPTPRDTPAPAGGGESGAGRAAEGGAGAGVDQPTTTFRAPRPPVDRPTSKFVALKPDVTTAVPQVGPERTTQQPLPPKPPLDLLAELTNTPPPPDTPVRTLVRRVKIWTPLVLLLVVVFAIVQAVRPLPAPTLDLTAESTYTFDGSQVDIPWPADGQAALDVQGIGSFGSSGDQKPVPIASVAKVMTAYVILRDHPLKSGEEGPKIEIDQAAEEQSNAGQESTVDVFAGDSITQREALESILIASANNVARLLARWDAGSEKAFVEKMNAAAEELGMTNTTYTDPSGLNDTTVSTAVDQVKLAKAAMEQPAFREVAAMMSYDDYKGQNHGNWNQLVGKNNVVGIKTGTTTSALGNLVFAAKQEVGGETRTIVGAVVRQPDAGGGILAAALDSGDQLIRAAQGALESATLLKKGDVVGYVDDGLGGRTPVVATKDVKAVGWAGLKVELDFKADSVPHEAKAGTKVGTLTVGDGGTAGAVKVPVALQSDLVEPGFTDKLTRVG